MYGTYLDTLSLVGVFPPIAPHDPTLSQKYIHTRIDTILVLVCVERVEKGGRGG